MPKTSRSVMKRYRASWDSIGINQLTARVPQVYKEKFLRYAALLRAEYMVELATEREVSEQMELLSRRNTSPMPGLDQLKAIMGEKRNDQQQARHEAINSAYSHYNNAVAGWNGAEPDSDKCIKRAAQMVAYSNLLLSLYDSYEAEYGGNAG